MPIGVTAPYRRRGCANRSGERRRKNQAARGTTSGPPGEGRPVEMEPSSDKAGLQISFFSEKQYQCGASIAALRVADSLSRAGASIHYNFDQKRPGPAIADAFASVAFEKVSANDRTSFSFALRTAIKNQNPDVAHFHNYSGDRRTILDIAATTPFIWTMHDTAPITGYHYRMDDLDGEPLEFKANLSPAPEWFWNELRDKPFALTAPSKWLANYARDAAPAHIIVRHIPNILSSNAFFPMDRALARAMVGLPPEGVFVLFFAGRGAWKRKNFEIVARALKANPDLAINVLVVGGAADRDALRDPRFIFFNGFDPVADAAKITALYNAADAFCISSLIDNLPNTVLEAIHCGRPVIGSNTGGVPDMVKDGANGWLFDPRDQDSVAAAFRRFLDDKPNWPARSGYSRRLAVSTFGASTVTKQFLDLYAEFQERGKKLAKKSDAGVARAPVNTGTPA